MPIVVEFQQSAFVNRPDTELSLDSRNEWWTLKQRASQCFQSSRKLCFTTGQLVVKPDHADVFFPGTLLRFDKTGGTVETDD